MSTKAIKVNFIIIASKKKNLHIYGFERIPIFYLFIYLRKIVFY